VKLPSALKSPWNLTAPRLRTSPSILDHQSHKVAIAVHGAAQSMCARSCVHLNRNDSVRTLAHAHAQPALTARTPERTTAPRVRRAAAGRPVPARPEFRRVRGGTRTGTIFIHVGAAPCSAAVWPIVRPNAWRHDAQPAPHNAPCCTAHSAQHSHLALNPARRADASSQPSWRRVRHPTTHGVHAGASGHSANPEADGKRQAM
jgi:hypothetical protein